MTDTELDAMLDQWDAPPARTELRESVRAGFAAEQRRKHESRWPMRWLAPRGRLFAGAAVGSVVFLLAMIQFFPQAFGTGSPPVHIPWTADSELLRYADDGSSSVEMYMTSYKLNASEELLLSRSVPGNVFMTAIDRTLDVMGPALSRLTLPFAVDANTLERARKMRREHPGVGFISGCSGDADSDCLTVGHDYFEKAASGCINGKIVDHATILNHATEAVRERWTEHGRMTIWSAPDLECFALKVTYEAQQPDGSFHLVRAKQTVKVTVNP